ncbi:MAG: serine/threonine protein kinase, partial [Ilumatobacter sp.]
METDDQDRRDGSPTPVGASRDQVPRDLEGTVFAGRYRLTRLLSAGANTVIYDGDEVTSHRPVTLKIVQPDLAVTSTFRERFDATIRGVAAMSHPNIAAVYDWGEARFGADPTMFVVIERLTAGSLRDMYDRGRRLSPSQALAVGLEACRGLDHAHRRGYVHGELTPSKLVFGDDRRLRIVDFGLAGMLAERQWEEPSSLSTHVARYASPEQALSLPVDGTTDVYALCLTLVEGVTGRLPFAADSTVATLAARVGKLMPVSADLGPLASVLERAGRPEAHERSSAAQFGRSLLQAAEKLPRPEPLPLLSSGLFETPPERLRDPDDPTGGVVRPSADDLVITLSDDDPVDEDPVDEDPVDEDPVDE